MRPIDTVLFDLDGTLLDTAPTFVHALNALRADRGEAPLFLATIRPVVSRGAKAMIAAAFPDSDDVERESLRSRFLDLYLADLLRDTTPFPGMDEVLDTLDRDGLRWGVVTNKPAWLTGPLLDHLGIAARAACVVSGDTLPVRKPDPRPLLHACESIGATPAATVYVGDAENDIRAGRAGGLATALALFGYLGPDDAIDTWAADVHLERPPSLLEWIESRRVGLRA